MTRDDALRPQRRRAAPPNARQWGSEFFVMPLPHHGVYSLRNLISPHAALVDDVVRWFLFKKTGKKKKKQQEKKSRRALSP